MKRIKKFKETGDLDYIYKNELDKACYARDATYSDSKDLANRTTSDKILKDGAYEIAINPKYEGLTSIVYKCFDKEAGSGATSKV